MERLLYITAFPPNHKSGGQTFSYNALRDLRNYYSIDLIYFTFGDHKYEAVEGVNVLRSVKPSMLGCVQMPTLYPVFTRRFSYDLLKYLKSIINEYDVLYFDFLQVATYSLFLKHGYKVIRCHDVLAQKYKREKSKLYPWVKRSEQRILCSANRIFTPSYKDSAIIQDIYGIDSEYSNEYLTQFTIQENVEVDDNFIVFGLWSRYENISGLAWFVENVIKPNKADVGKKIIVMGGGLSKEDNEKYLKPFGIRYLGYVEDSYSEIIKHKAMIAPLFDGAGIKVKVLDSFNTGTPVIGTDIAFEGIKDLELLTYRANTPKEFLKMMNDTIVPDIRQKAKLQKQFLEYYDNRHLAEMLWKGRTQL